MLSDGLPTTSNGIPYQEYPAGSQGAGFILYPQAHHSPADIKQAKAEIRYSRDVVHLRIANDSDWNDRYLHAILRHPEVKLLKWFEMNLVNSLIQRERKKGTPSEEFVNLYILPNVDQVRAKNLKKFPWLKKS